MNFKLTPPALKLREKDVTRQILDLLAYEGYIAVRLHVGKFVPLRVAVQAVEAANKQLLYSNVIEINEPGTPDWLAVHPVRPCLWLEMKGHRGKISLEQKQYLDYLTKKRRFSGGAFQSLDDLRKYLAELAMSRKNVPCPE